MDPVKYTVMLRMYCIMDMLLLRVFFCWWYSHLCIKRRTG